MSQLMGLLILLLGVPQTAAPAPGQQTAPLSGRWALVADPAAAGGGRGSRIPATAGSGWGQELTIAQTASTVSIERAQFSAYDMQPPMRFEYALDGAESRNVFDIGRGLQEQTSSAAWNGTSLTIVTRHGRGTALAVEITQVFTVDAAGILSIETTRGGADPSSRSTTLTHYRRVEEGKK